MKPSLISINDTARMLGIGRTKVYGLIKERTLDSHKIGTRTLIPLASIEALIQASAV